MPIIYLAPSTQDFNPTVLGQSEEYYMNRIADALEPHLRACGIRYVRNSPEMTTAAGIRQSNAGRFDLHLALHSNAAPGELSGRIRGSDAYYARGSKRGEEAAEDIAEALERVYPGPVRVLETAGLGEVTRTAAPAVLLELAYHDNREDAEWLRDRAEDIAEALAKGLCDFFDIPYAAPMAPRRGVVAVDWGSLNLRARPVLKSRVLARMPKGAAVTLLGDPGDGWYVLEYRGQVGYGAKRYIR